MPRNLFQKHHLVSYLVLILAACSADKPSELDFNGTTELEISIDTLAVAKMEILRLDALSAGVITQDSKTKFPCTIKYGNKIFEAKIRFKGDWTDHLSGDKYSYRIELKEGAILGKRTFSVQNPSTRGYGQEWLIHKLFKHNQVLTTDYQFVPLRLNGKLLGVYAFEEHFEKELPLSQNRPESVILKYDESLFWECRALELRGEVPGYFPLFVAAEVVPFSKKKSWGKKRLREDLKLGLDLMETYRSFNPNADQYLDLDRFAQFYAILTLSNSKHGSVWHNQRLYLNPDNNRLEPIGFDVYGNPETRIDSCVVFNHITARNDRWPIVEVTRHYEQFLFSNLGFRRLYFEHLERVSNSKYLSSFFASIALEIDSINELFQEEYSEIIADTSLLQTNAVLVRNGTKQFKHWFDSESSKSIPDSTNYRPTMKDGVSNLIPVRVYQEGSRKYMVENCTGKTITAVAYRVKKNKQIIEISDVKHLGTSHWQRNRKTLTLPPKVKDVLFSFEGDTNLKVVSVTPWPAPKPLSFFSNEKSSSTVY